MSDVCKVHSVDLDKLRRINNEKQTEKVLNGVSLFFKVLGDTTRIKILDCLAKDELCVCEIEELLKLSQSLISHQLKKLKDNNIVKTRRDGKKIYYSIKDEHVKSIYLTCVEHFINC